MDGEISALRAVFAGVQDLRASNSSHRLGDIFMSGFAMFSLKYPSLLDFEQQTVVERENLERVYGISKVCSDAQMRKVLDAHNPDFLRQVLVSKFGVLASSGILKEYAYQIGSQSYLLVSCDGVEHFSSKKVNCPCCLKKEHRNGSCTYHHNLLCAAVVHPRKREVFLLQTEPIIRQDGHTKNDCERNAAKRLQENMSADYASFSEKHRFLFVEDALYANAPHIKTLENNGYAYLLNVKPDSHKTLFAQVEARKQRQQTNTYSISTPDGLHHRFEWCNNVLLCNAHPDLRVNALCYEQTDKKGKKTQFTWITNLKISQTNLFALMRAARARWKIENETFNTLKNLGYHFEHNYGHGDDHLSVLLAYLMLLAFYIDQLVQACCRTFQTLEQNILTKAKLWSTIRAVFQTQICHSMNNIYLTIAALFKIQLE